MLRSEIRRATRNPLIAIVILVLAGSIIFNYIDSLDFYRQAQDNPALDYHPYYFNAFEVFLFSLASSVFISLSVVASTIPFADSLVQDRENGYFRYAVLRGGYWSFLGSKIVANWLVGGFTVASAMIIAFAVAALLFPLHLPPLHIDGIKVSQYGIPDAPLVFLFESMPGTFILLRIGLGFLFGGCYATVGFALATFSKNRYVVLAAPLVIFVSVTVALSLIGLHGWVLPVAFVPELNTNSSLTSIIGIYVIVYGASLLLSAIVLAYNAYIKGERSI